MLWVAPMRLTIVAQSTSGTPRQCIGDVREEAMFDLVPLAGARREVADDDRQPGAGGEALKFPLPQAGPGAVAAARIGRDDERARAGIGRPPHAPPPARMASTAKLAVSWSIPTLTHPSSRCRS